MEGHFEFFIDFHGLKGPGVPKHPPPPTHTHTHAHTITTRTHSPPGTYLTAFTHAPADDVNTGKLLTALRAETKRIMVLDPREVTTPARRL